MATCRLNIFNLDRKNKRKHVFAIATILGIDVMSASTSRDKLYKNKAVDTDDLFHPEAYVTYTCPERCFFYMAVALSLITLPFSLLFLTLVVNEYERMVILRTGKLRGVFGPGIIIYYCCVEEKVDVDLRMEVMAIRPQEVLTKDSCSVSVDAVVYYRVFDPISAVVKIFDYRKATLMMAASTLRNVVGQENILDMFSERTKMAKSIQEILDRTAVKWGIYIERVEMREVALPQDMQRAMAAEAEATRDARAKMIVSEGEMKASEALKEASDILGRSEAAIQLRYLQTLVSIKNERTKTLVFPVPPRWTK